MSNFGKNELGFFENAPLKAGVLIGVLPLPLHYRLPHEDSVLLAALTVVIIASIYIGYAFNDGRRHILATESMAATLFLGAAWFGLKGHEWAIIAAYGAHGLWDLAHHTIVGTHMPRWYIPLCAVVDWIIAAGLYLMWYPNSF